MSDSVNDRPLGPYETVMQTGRAIPGFFWDEYRQRYFAIKQDHQVPEDSRYSHSQSQRDARAVKRKRLEAQHKLQRSMQRVEHSAAFAKPSVGSVASLREVSGGSKDAYFTNASEALVQQFELADPIRTRKHYPVFQVHRAAPDPANDRIIFDVKADGRQAFTSVRWDQHRFDKNINTFTFPSAAGTNSVLDHNTTHFWPSISPTNYVYTDYPGTRLYVGDLDEPGQRPSRHRPYYLGLPEDPLGPITAVAVSDQGKIANAHDQGLSLMDLTVRAYDTYRPGYQIADANGRFESLDWLNDQVVVAAQSRFIRLWDTRSNATAPRSSLESRVTGVKAVPWSSQELLAATNRGISLIDLRMISPRKQLVPLRIPGIHDGINAQFDVSPERMLVSYTDMQYKVHSLRNGAHLHTLARLQDRRHEAGVSAPTQVAWAEDMCGCPYVFACDGSGFHRWSPHIGGSEEDVDDEEDEGEMEED